MSELIEKIEQLKRCPFCGGYPVRYGAMVRCDNERCEICDISVPADDWEIRPIEDALLKRSLEAEALVNALLDKNQEKNSEIDKLKAELSVRYRGLSLLSRAAERLLSEIATANHWIPISEQLPEIDKNVITLTFKGVPVCAFLNDDGRWYGLDGDEINQIRRGVTHWLPLPPAPEANP